MQRTYGGTHNELVAAVQAATGADTELFASPLDVHRNMPSYLSTHPRDQLFGAGMDAYSHRWVGACFAHPPEQPEELERAVRWALASAREADRHTPVLTVMLLPDNAALTAVDAAPHARWLAYPEVVDLACFPPSVAPLLAALCYSHPAMIGPLSKLLCRGGWARFLVVVVCGSSTCPSPPLVCLPPLGWPSGAPRLPPRPLRPTAP